MLGIGSLIRMNKGDSHENASHHHGSGGAARRDQPGPARWRRLDEVSLGDIKRTNLLRHDLSAPGREVIQVLVEFGPGVTAVRHSHPGEELVYVTEGSLEYQLDGRPPVTRQGGRSAVHPARNAPRGEERRHRQGRRARHLHRRKRQAASRAERVSDHAPSIIKPEETNMTTMTQVRSEAAIRPRARGRSTEVRGRRHPGLGRRSRQAAFTAAWAGGSTPTSSSATIFGACSSRLQARRPRFTSARE